MKKKVGILTFHQAINYGAVLQAYALKEVCDSLGFETHIINYSSSDYSTYPRPLKELLKSQNKKIGIIVFVRNITSYLSDIKKWRLFYKFRKTYLSESPLCVDINDIEKLKYDYYIAGSDQIWNYKITGNEFDSCFFGQMQDNSVKIIYAASAHDTPFPLDKELQFKKYLENMPSAVSIREKKLADYVLNLTGKRYPIVLDPTLLAGREVLERLCDKNQYKYPYILLYQIDSNPESDISVKSLEKRFKCKVYTMTVPRIGSIHGRKGVSSPQKFLSLLKDSEFVVTNSFHGIALSLLFEKNFFVYENGGVMTRIDGLLDSLDLMSRKVKMVDDIKIENFIDYAPVKEKLEKLRIKSYSFLRKAFKNEITIRTENKDKNKNMPILPFRDRRKKDCSGCFACVETCPKQAIKMKIDEEGFQYPEIDEGKCIHCGICDRICGFVFVSRKNGRYNYPKAFGVKHKEMKTRITSRSGGAFVALSDIILKKDGVIYGAAMQEDFQVKHIRATCKEERDLMKKAKYVQSDITGILPQVAEDLILDKYVLFSGTPCQIEGIYTYLKQKNISSEKLFCCDLICHGVPSPLIWKSYLSYVEEKQNGKIIDANFRDKQFGWDSHYESFIMDGARKKYVSREFTDLFYQHIMFRPSCYSCKFANIHRPGDITLGDFWGIEKNSDSFNDNKGVSLVLINTKKGMELFHIAKKNMEIIECKLSNCLQPTLIKPSTPSANRAQFWNDFYQISFSNLIKKYTRPISKYSRAKKRIKLILYYLKLRRCP